MNSPGLSGAPEPGVGSSPLPSIDRLRQPVAIAEVIVGMVERRRRLQVQRREHFDTLAPRDELCVLRLRIVPRSASSRANRIAMA